MSECSLKPFLLVCVLAVSSTFFFFFKCSKHFKCFYAINNKCVFHSLLRDIQNSSEYIKRMKINGHFS